MTDINFTVTASHQSPRFNFVDEPVRVRQYAGTELFYAVGALGCSKNYSTPEAAAGSMFYDHWCTNVRVTKVAPAEDTVPSSRYVASAFSYDRD